MGDLLLATTTLVVIAIGVMGKAETYRSRLSHFDRLNPPPRAGTRLIGAGDLSPIASPSVLHDLALAAERTYMGFRATAGTSKATATVIVPALHALVVAPVEGSVVLMFVTVGFAAMAIGAFSNFVGYRIRRHDGRREAR